MRFLTLWAAALLAAACSYQAPTVEESPSAGLSVPAVKHAPALAAESADGVQASGQKQTEQEPQDLPCSALSLPATKETAFSCHKNSDGICAHFENGKMFYCITSDGTRSYQSNKWASALTSVFKDKQGRILNLYYYAYGKLARTEEYDYSSGVITRVWYNDAPIRLTRTELGGRVLDKYYFTKDRPYVRYPDGNDMAEINGEWELREDILLTDGQPLHTLSRPPFTPWETGWDLIK